jgi:hypothetical protein
VLYDDNHGKLQQVNRCLPKVTGTDGTKHRITVFDPSLDNEPPAAFSKSNENLFARTLGLNKRVFDKALLSFQSYAEETSDVFIVFDGGHSRAGEHAKRELAKAIPKCVTSCIELIPKEADQEKRFTYKKSGAKRQRTTLLAGLGNASGRERLIVFTQDVELQVHLL